MTTSAWTAERRARQASAIHSWRPWESSTGPRSTAGKRASSRNSAKPNSPRQQLLAIRRELAEVMRKMMQIAARRRSRRQMQHTAGHASPTVGSQ